MAEGDMTTVRVDSTYITADTTLITADNDLGPLSTGVEEEPVLSVGGILRVHSKLFPSNKSVKIKH